MPSKAKQRTGRKTPLTKGQKKRASPRSGQWKINPYVDMVLNPCDSTLVPGLYGSSEGLLARLKTTHHVTALGGTVHGASTCGFVLWCPDYHNLDDGAAGPRAPWTSQGNLFAWQNTDPSVSPTNSDAYPFGTNRDPVIDGTLTTQVLDDPAAQLMNSDIVSDARVISACIDMTYYGAMYDSAGEVGFISNLPVADLLYGAKGRNPLSVDNLMIYCNNKERLGVDTLENVYRLNELSSNHYRGQDDSLLTIGQVGAAGSVTTVSETADALSPRVFGFVWRNTLPDAGLVFDFTKSIEWRAEASSGLTQVPIHTTGRSLVPDINASIDAHERRHGGRMWERVKQGVRSVRSEISKIAFTGVGNLIREGTSYLTKAGFGQGMNFLAGAAPLMLL